MNMKITTALMILTTANSGIPRNSQSDKVQAENDFPKQDPTFTTGDVCRSLA